MAPVDQPPPIRCSIVRQAHGSRVQLHGRLTSPASTHGRYSLHIVKSGPSGSSTVDQRGQFSAAAETETSVGSASFNQAPGVRFVAQLSLQVGGRAYHCEQSDRGSR
jgi:hypothetical protein